MIETGQPQCPVSWLASSPSTPGAELLLGQAGIGVELPRTDRGVFPGQARVQRRDGTVVPVSAITSVYEKNTDQVFPVIVLEGVPAPA